MNLNFNLHLRAQRLRAHVFGDLDAAMAVFRRDVEVAAARGESNDDSLRNARARSARGVASSGIGAVAFLMFCAIDSRWIAPRWPIASIAWFALALAGALVFAWRYYAVIGSLGWRRAWYRLTGDPRIEDFPAERAIEPLSRMLSRWKLFVRLAGFAGTMLLLAGMAAIRFAPMEWRNPGYWAVMPVVAAAVYWPSIYLDAIKQAYHPMCAARWFGDACQSSRHTTPPLASSAAGECCEQRRTVPHAARRPERH